MFLIEKIDEILKLLKENNDMLRMILSFIALKEFGAVSENNDDFIRNVLANLISNKIENNNGSFNGNNTDNTK